MFYGRNLDALWDCLTGFIETPAVITFVRLAAVKKDLRPDVEDMLGIFQRAVDMYGEIEIRLYDDDGPQDA